MTSEKTQLAEHRKSFPPFQPPPRLLFSPGPTPVPESVLQAMTKTVLGHLDPEFLRCMDEVKEMLQYVFETQNRSLEAKEHSVCSRRSTKLFF